MTHLEQIYVCPGSDVFKTSQIRRDFLDDLFYGLAFLDALRKSYMRRKLKAPGQRLLIDICGSYVCGEIEDSFDIKKITKR